MVPLRKDLRDQVVSLLELGDLPVDPHDCDGFQASLDPQIEVLRLPPLVVQQTDLSKGQDAADLVFIAL